MISDWRSNLVLSDNIATTACDRTHSQQSVGQVNFAAQSYTPMLKKDSIDV